MLENLESICYNKFLMKDSKDTPEPEMESDGGPADDGGRRLNRYLSELIHMQDARLLKPGDLQALADKHQLQPGDTEKLDMLIERHLSRALEYKGRERWDNAIVETERALLFAPLDNAVRLDLAELYLNRSAKYGYLQKDLQRSERQVGDALILEPDNREARSFQKELKKLQDMLKGRGNKRRYIPLLVILLLILGAAVYPRVRSLFRFASTDEAPISRSSAPSEWREREREMDWNSSSDLSEEIGIHLSDRTLAKDGDTGLPSLSLSGYAEALKDGYEKLDVELFFDGQSLGVIPLIEEGAPPLRQGETAVFSALLHPGGDLETEQPLRFALKESEKLREERPPEWTPVDPYSRIPLPRGVFLSMDSRRDRMIEGYDRSYLFMDLRIRNKGREALSRLDILARWRDEDESVIAEKEIFLIRDARLPLREGEIRTERIMFSMNKEESARNASLEILLAKTEKENDESQ